MSPLERVRWKGHARDPFSGTVIDVKVVLAFYQGKLVDVALESPGEYISRCSMVEQLSPAKEANEG